MVKGLGRSRVTVESPGVDAPPVPVRSADETYGEVRDTARRVLPGARFRQRLFFRYTLEWTRPAEA